MAYAIICLTLGVWETILWKSIAFTSTDNHTHTRTHTSTININYNLKLQFCEPHHSLNKFYSQFTAVSERLPLEAGSHRPLIYNDAVWLWCIAFNGLFSESVCVLVSVSDSVSHHSSSFFFVLSRWLGCLHPFIIRSNMFDLCSVDVSVFWFFFLEVLKYFILFTFVLWPPPPTSISSNIECENVGSRL